MISNTPYITSGVMWSISSSHSKISAICWCHFLVWVLIPIDGAAIDGDMLAIVLRTFLARSSWVFIALVGHYCHYISPDAKLLIFQRLRQDRKWSKKGMTEMLHVQQFWKSTHFGKNDLFEGVRVKKNGQNFLTLPVIYIKNTACKKFGPNRSFEPSGVRKAIYNGLCEVATTN